MGKKGSWFSAIKRVFTHNSKEKPSDGFDKKASNEKKKGKGILRHGESKSFIPLFREPSSIEKILGEADQLLIRPPTSSNRASFPTVAPPTVSSKRHTLPNAFSPRAVSPKAGFPSIFAAGSSETDSSKVFRSRKEISYVRRPEHTLRNQHFSATTIQSAYRGYLARRNFRALRGLVRLQGMVRSQNTKRQTINAMKQMQLLVRVQTQIQSRRIQMLENQTLHHQANKKKEKELESVLSKWIMDQTPEAEVNEDWDDSVLTKEEVEARLRKKLEAVMKRERAMAYAYSHQLWNGTNRKSAQIPLDNQSNGFPWWWNWLERQLPPTNTPQTQATTKKAAITSPRPMISDNKPSPQLNATNYKHKNPTFNSQEPISTKHFQTTPITTPSPANVSGFIKYSKPKPNYSPYNDLPMRDDDSLTSCPPFSVPNYMTPTASAKAKARANSNPKERLQETTPVNDSKRRFSFSFTPNIGSFKWNKGSKNDPASRKVVSEKRQFTRSIGDLSVDSAVSLPAMVGRKPFNRFV